MSSKKHGLWHHRLYPTWTAMMARCRNSKATGYEHYGGRGIKVCDRWLDVSKFIEDMFPSYKEGLRLDRVNNDGNYEPSNCRWATVSNNLKNRRTKSAIQSDIDLVHYNKRSKRWYVMLPFKTKEEAEKYALRAMVS